MAEVGRNDPCPCGSGKKFKKCHFLLEDESPAARAAALHPLGRRMVDEIVDFGRRHFGEAWAPGEVWDEFDIPIDRDTLQLFMPWVAYHYRPRDVTTAEAFLAIRGSKLPEAERALVEAEARAWLSIWEIEDTTPGVGLKLLDLLSGERRGVLEKRGSETLVRGDAVLARVLDHDGLSVVAGMHPRALKPQDAALAVKLARKVLKVRRKLVPLATLREPGGEMDLLSVWEDVLDELREQPMPELRNTDGHQLLLTADHLTFEPSTRDEVWRRLVALPGAEPDDARAAIDFIREDERASGRVERTVVGRAELSNPGKLTLRTNSIVRADDLRELVETACAGLLRHRLRDHQDLEPMLEQLKDELAPSLREQNAAVAARLRQYKAEHYATWVDEALPALGGLTPRQATQDKQRRKHLLGLLKEMENSEARLPAEERFDFSGIRRDLGV